MPPKGKKTRTTTGDPAVKKNRAQRKRKRVRR